MIEILLKLKGILASITALLLTFAPIAPQKDIILGGIPQTEKDWNSTTIKTGDTATTEFHVKWIHWLDASGWKPIDTSFATSSDGTKFVMLNAPFKAEAPLRSTGVAKMINDNKWNVFNKTEITEPSLTMSITAFDVVDVAGKLTIGDLNVPSGIQKNVSYVLYKNAYPEGDLIYYIDFGNAPRFEKLVRINSAPTKLNYAFSLSYDAKVNFGQIIAGQKRNWDEIETFVFDKEKPISVRKDGSFMRGMGMSKIQVWDSAIPKIKIESVNVNFQKTGQNTFTLTKNLSSAFFTGAIYPVYTDVTTKFFPDPNVETTSVDGFVQRNAVTETWATIRTGAGVGADDTSAIFEFYCRATATTDDWTTCVTVIMLFDISSIGSSSTITSATSSQFQGASGVADNFDFGANMTTSTPASNTGLVAGDYTQTGLTKIAQSLDFGSFTASAYNDFPFNAKGTSYLSDRRTSVAKLAMRIDKHQSASTTPAWVANTNGGWTGAADSLISADTAGTAKDPRLTIVYSGAATPKNFEDDNIFLQLLFNIFRVNYALAI